jgi:hypothetical protein
MFVFLSYDFLHIQIQMLKHRRQNLLQPMIAEIQTYFRSLLSVDSRFGSTTEIVKLALVVIYPCAGIETLALASWMTLD